MADIRAGSPTQPIGQYKPFHINALAATPTPIGVGVNTTIAVAITAGNSVTVTPAAMTNITKGKRLNIVNGSTTENFTVLSVTSTTFTATFVNSYGTASNLYSVDGTWLGVAIIGGVGSATALTLYNGLPGMLPKAGAIFSVIAPVAGQTYWFMCNCEMGLFYTYTGTTAGDVTITALDHPPSAVL